VTIVLAPDTEKRDIEIPIQLRKALGAALVIAGVLPLTLRIRGHVVAPSAGT
jgi:hypothetical protein